MAQLLLSTFSDNEIYQSGYSHEFSFAADYKIIRAIEQIADIQERYTKNTKFIWATIW